MEKRFQKRLTVTAGMHDVGVSFIKKSSATTVELLQPFERERLDPITPVGIPELDRVTVEGPFNPVQSRAIAEPAAGLHLHTGERSRGDAVRADDSVIGRAPRVSRAGQRDRNDAAPQLLREGARARRVVRSGHRKRADLPARQPALPVSGRTGSRELSLAALPIASTTRARVTALVLPLEQHPRR